MSTMNRVFLMGNLTRDPQLRHTPGGQSVSDLGLAVSERHRNKTGEVVESTCFADIVVWGRQAEACGRFLLKGARVMVEGRLQFDQWQAGNGERRSRLRVRADRVQFLGKIRPETAAPAHAVPAAGQPASEAQHEALPF